MIQPAGYTAPTSYAASASSSRNTTNDTQSSSKANNYDKDTVEISDEYYASKNLRGETGAKWINATDEEMASGGRYVKDANGNYVFQSAKKAYEEKGIQGLKESLVPGEMNARMSEEVLNALEFLPGEKREIAALIDSAAGKAGLSKGDIKKLKIEVDSNGKIVVGGLKDKATLKKVQDALNGVDGLAKRIENFQFMEKNLYEKVKSLNVTPYQLMEDGRTTLSGMDYLEWKVSQTDDPDSIEGLEDPLAYALIEYFKDPIETADFSHKASGVANPQGDMEKAVFDVKNKIAEKFMEHNRTVEGSDDSNPSIIKWNNAKIRITESGGIEIEGRFSKNDEANAHAESIVRQMIQEAMMPSEDGTESVFTTALTRISLMHDEAYGDSEDTGVMKEAVFEFTNSSTNAYVIDRAGDSEEKTTDSIKKDVAAFINENSPDAKVNKSDLSISKDGRIKFNGANNAAVSGILDQVNSAILTVKNGGKLDMSSSLNQLAVDVMKKMQSMDAYGPNASKKFLNYKSADQEDQEHATKYNKWMETQDYTYSTWDASNAANEPARYAKPRF